jgi:hypothetical protein
MFKIIAAAVFTIIAIAVAGLSATSKENDTVASCDGYSICAYPPGVYVNDQPARHVVRSQEIFSEMALKGRPGN